MLPAEGAQIRTSQAGKFYRARVEGCLGGALRYLSCGRVRIPRGTADAPHKMSYWDSVRIRRVSRVQGTSQHVQSNLPWSSDISGECGQRRLPCAVGGDSLAGGGYTLPNMRASPGAPESLEHRIVYGDRASILASDCKTLDGTVVCFICCRLWHVFCRDLLRTSR